MMRQKIRQKNLDQIVHQRNKKKVETKLHPLKEKILLLKKLYQKKRINHQLYTKVLHQDDIDHHQEVRLIEEDLLEDIQGHDELVLHQEEEESRDLRGDITDILYLEVEVDRDMIVMDHGGDCHLFLDVEDLILDEDQDHLGDRGIDGKDLENVVEVVVEQEVDLDDPPWATLL